MGIKNLTFTDNNPPQCDAEWLNSVKSETNNFITSAGGSPTVSDLNQVSFSTAVYAAGADFYTDSSAGPDVYIASVVGVKKAPEAYFVGMRVRFVPGNTNTGSSTINVAGLGVKNIKSQDGTSDPDAGDLLVDVEVVLSYDGTNFRLVIFANIAGGVALILQDFTSGIVALSSSATFPNDDTTPLVSEGVEISSQAITPATTSSKIKLWLNVTGDISSNAEIVALVAFRGSTAIGASLGTVNTVRPFCLGLNIVDSPSTTSATTYSIRAGITTGTGPFRINRRATDIFNGELAKTGFSIQELSS